MSRKILSLLTAALLGPVSAIHAQEAEFRCGANELERMGDLVVGHPERVQEIAQAKAQLDAFTQAWEQASSRDDNTYIIPVVFHIIHNAGPENIGNQRIYDAVRELNEDWNKLNDDWMDVQPEFLDRVADMQVTFKLAQLDPAGNCTNGITRTQSPLTSDGGQTMKNLIQWPRDRYLNIWVSASAGDANVAGYSMYPSSVAGTWGAAADGIVMQYSFVGAGGQHVLSHEVGHWLNLMHCWGDSNEPGLASNCGMDDGVADTPNSRGWTSCNLRGESCGILNNVENYMEYAGCRRMFTTGQKARTHAALNSGTALRSNLWSPANLALTGVSLDPVICTADFGVSRRVVCPGQSVTFTDASYNGITEWAWTFEGGTPATSTEAAPAVTYDAPGTYSVSLTVGNGAQSMSKTEQAYIQVLPAIGTPLPFAEGFEGMANLSNSPWEVNDVQGDGTFTVSSSAAYTGSRSLMLVNTAAKAGNIDELITAPIDVTIDPPAILGFRYAFARRSNSNADGLRIYASRDCGATWTLRRNLSGANLATVTNKAGSFIPNGPDQWAYNELAPIAAPFIVSNLRFKFVFQSDGGNNLWLDDININGASVGIEEVASSAGQPLMVVPNPAKDRAEAMAFLKDPGAVKVELVDLLGRPVRLVEEGPRPAGPARWTLDLGGLPGGMYFVRVRQGDGVQVAKFSKE